MERTGRSVSTAAAAATRGRVNVSAVIAGISGLLVSDTRYNRTAVRLFPRRPASALALGRLRRGLLRGRARVGQGSAGVFEVCAHEPLELLQLGGVVDQDVLGDRVELFGLVDGLAGVLDDAVVDQVERGQVRLHSVAAHRIVVPGAVFQDRAWSALRRATE